MRSRYQIDAHSLVTSQNNAHRCVSNHVAIMVPSARLLRLAHYICTLTTRPVFAPIFLPSASFPRFPAEARQRQTMVQKELAPLIGKQKGKHPTTLPCLLSPPLFFLLPLFFFFSSFFSSQRALLAMWRRRQHTAVVCQPTHLLEPRRLLRGARVIFFSRGSHLQLCVNWLLRRRALCVFRRTAESSCRRGWRPRCVLHPGGP